VGGGAGGSTEEAVSSRAWRALAVGAGGYVLFGFNSTATNLAFGSIAEDFDGVSESVVSWVASGYFIASAAFLPLAGRLADRLGRRRVFNAGLIGFAITAVVSAIAPNVWVLIAARTAQAASAALVIPSSLSMALPEFPEHRRSSAVATWAAAGPLSAAIAPSAAAAILGISSWRIVYLVTAPAALVAFAASLKFVGRSRADEVEGRLDLAGTALATMAIGLLILSISQGTAWGWTSPTTLGALVASLLLGALFLVRSSRHPTPLLNLSLFRVPQVAVANLANLSMSITSLSIWLVWPLFLDRVWEYPPARIGLAITAGPICAGPASLLGGRLADRFGQRWLMIGGSALATCAVLWSWWRLGSEPNYVRDLLPSVAMFGAGWGLSNPSMNSWALAEVPQAVYGEVNAAFNTIRNLGAAIGVSIAVAIIGAEDRPDVVAAYGRANLFFATCVAISCLTVAFGVALVSRRRSPAILDP
jgi:EmrB/QacA subfamily drug resistance transporter